MKSIFQPGDKKQFTRIVGQKDTAAFDNSQVHPVYATFALGRDAEWCCRLFVLEMKDEHEEGIGTFLTVYHQSPALLGSEVHFEAEVIRLEKNEIVCKYTATIGSRVVATGEQGQKIIKKERIQELFESFK